MGSGFADRPVVPAVPHPRTPIDRLQFKIARQVEAAPIHYVAELISTDTDSERAIRRLIALCYDPLAIALTAATSAQRSTAV